MKRYFYIFIILLTFGSSAFGQPKTNIIGTYIGDPKNGFQKLTINPDSTFQYVYRDKIAHLATSTVKGKWTITKNKLILNSEYKMSDYIVKENKIENSDSVVISVRNKQLKPIWIFRRVMLNQDPAKTGMFMSYLNNDFSKDTVFCKIFTTQTTEITIHNNFYPVFIYKPNNINANQFDIVGDFSDDIWYRYFENTKLKIKKNKLKGDKSLGTFTKDK